ncbi:MAG TPA: flavin reductase family protein [Sphingobium sp.]|uniref:flavin reductase family protein n=1 Tax=Sphingobium sp. TaxID=1912891 RepID=UPI002ED176A3
MTLDPANFRAMMSHYPTGVCVITSLAATGEALGMTVGTFTSVSLDPPLVGFLPDKRSTSWPDIAATGRFCVNILAEGQEWLCRKFSAPVRDRFSDVVYRLSENGLPLLDGAGAWIECAIHAVHEAGDHLFVLGVVEAITAEPTASPLVFLRGKFGQVTCLEA